MGAVIREDPRDPAFRMAAEPGTADISILGSRKELALINSCPRDAHLRFEADGHRYFYENAEVSCSVSRLQG